MARKLDLLPKLPPPKRSFNQMNFRGGGGMMRGGFQQPPPWFNYNNGGPPPPPHQFQQFKKRKTDNPAVSSSNSPAPVSTNDGPTMTDQERAALEIDKSQNNAISKLYEFAKKLRHPEPIFSTVSENVLETRRTERGYNLKKTEFTVECDVMGKKFTGSALNKKAAKQLAASAAWAELGPAGVGQSSIDSLLQSQRSNSDKK